MLSKTILAAAMSIVAGSAQASTTIDFSTYAQGTLIGTVGDATFSLYGGPVSSGQPEVGSFYTSSLGNSSTGNYPTSSGVQIDFARAVKDVSFTFSNFGDNGVSFEKATNGGTQVDFQNIGYVNGFATVNVAGRHITSLQIDNGEGGSRSWEFGIGSVTFSNAVPEPATWAMMLAGCGFGGATLRRRAPTTVAA